MSSEVGDMTNICVDVTGRIPLRRFPPYIWDYLHLTCVNDAGDGGADDLIWTSEEEEEEEEGQKEEKEEKEVERGGQEEGGGGGGGLTHVLATNHRHPSMTRDTWHTLARPQESWKYPKPAPSGRQD